VGFDDGSESDDRLFDLTLKGRKANGVIVGVALVHVGQIFYFILKSIQLVESFFGQSKLKCDSTSIGIDSFTIAEITA
jgi:hypothetical protein